MITLTFLILATFFGVLSTRALLARNWSGAILSGAFSLKLVLMLIMEKGVKYYFVWDSMKYEQDAWALAKAWLFDESIDLDRLGAHSQLMAAVYFVFGNTPIISSFINALFSSLALYLAWTMTKDWIGETAHGQMSLYRGRTNFDFDKKTLGNLTLFFAALYPSFNVWSVTNTKDPIIVLSGLFTVWCWMKVFVRPGHWLNKLLWFCGLGFSVYLLYLYRPYLAGLLVGTLVVGQFLVWIFRVKRPLLALATMGAISLIALVVASYLFPDLRNEWLYYVEYRRGNFTNEGYDDFARTAFLMNYSFRTIWDLLLFIPQSLVYYFFAPFVWGVKSFASATGLLESIPFLFMTPFIVKGIRSAAKFSPKETFLLLLCVVTMALAQALIISNVGTIFRHRALPLFILLIFLEWNRCKEKQES